VSLDLDIRSAPEPASTCKESGVHVGASADEFYTALWISQTSLKTVVMWNAKEKIRIPRKTSNERSKGNKKRQQPDVAS